MKVTLLRDARIKHKAGETVEVSPAEFQYLTSTGSAVPAGTDAGTDKKPAKPARKNTA